MFISNLCTSLNPFVFLVRTSMKDNMTLKQITLIYELYKFELLTVVPILFFNLKE